MKRGLLLALAITFSPPKTATRTHLFEYTAPYFGFCARGNHCKTGERWVSDAKALDAVWDAPASLTLEALEEHYKQAFQAAGWKFLGSAFTEETQTKYLSAAKLENGSWHGVDITISTAGLDGRTTKLRRIEYWEGIGKPFSSVVNSR